MSNRQIKMPTYIANKFPQKVNMQNLETLTSVRNINISKNNNGNSTAANKPIPMPRFSSKGYNFITIKGNNQQLTGQTHSKAFNNTRHSIQDPELEQQDKNWKDFCHSSGIFSSEGERKGNYLNAELIQQLQSVKKQLQLKQNQISAHRQDKDKFNEKIRILSSELQSSQQSCKILGHKLKLKQAELAKLQTTFKDIFSSLELQQLQHQKQQANFEQELKDRQAAIALLHQEREKLISQNTHLTQELSKYLLKKQKKPSLQPHKNDEPLLKQIKQLKEQLGQQKDKNQQLALANSLIESTIDNLDKTLKSEFRKSGKLQSRILNSEILRQNYECILQYTNQELFRLKLRNINAKYIETEGDGQDSHRNLDHCL